MKILKRIGPKIEPCGIEITKFGKGQVCYLFLKFSSRLFRYDTATIRMHFCYKKDMWDAVKHFSPSVQLLQTSYCLV